MKRSLAFLLVISLAVVMLVAMGCEVDDPVDEPVDDPDEEVLPVVRASHQPCMHALPTWMGMQLGWPEEHGIEIEYSYFASGAPQIEALGAEQWDVGATGSVPMFSAARSYDAYMIAVSNDESETNDMWVRPDSPILDTKGYNPDYPDIYGSPEDVAGAEILCTTISTGHYAVVATLEALGLSEADVTITHMEQDAALAAFEAGEGDILQMWAPFGFLAQNEGFVKMSSGARAGAIIPGAVIADRQFADENPELVVRWLDMYFRGLEKMKYESDEALEWLGEYYRDYCGLDLDNETVAPELDQDVRPIFDVDEQIALFEDGTVHQWMGDLAGFFVGQGVWQQDEKDYVIEGDHINVEFLKMLAEHRAEQ